MGTKQTKNDLCRYITAEEGRWNLSIGGVHKTSILRQSATPPPVLTEGLEFRPFYGWGSDKPIGWVWYPAERRRWFWATWLLMGACVAASLLSGVFVWVGLALWVLISLAELSR